MGVATAFDIVLFHIGENFEWGDAWLWCRFWDHLDRNIFVDEGGSTADTWVGQEEVEASKCPLDSSRDTYWQSVRFKDSWPSFHRCEWHHIVGSWTSPSLGWRWYWCWYRGWGRDRCSDRCFGSLRRLFVYFRSVLSNRWRCWVHSRTTGRRYWRGALSGGTFHGRFFFGRWFLFFNRGVFFRRWFLFGRWFLFFDMWVFHRWFLPNRCSWSSWRFLLGGCSWSSWRFLFGRCLLSHRWFLFDRWLFSIGWRFFLGWVDQAFFFRRLFRRRHGWDLQEELLNMSFSYLYCRLIYVFYWRRGHGSWCWRRGWLLLWYAARGKPVVDRVESFPGI